MGSNSQVAPWTWNSGNQGPPSFEEEDLRLVSIDMTCIYILSCIQENFGEYIPDTAAVGEMAPPGPQPKPSPKSAKSRRERCRAPQ